MPRATMSVATSTRTWPSRNALSARWRAFCALLPWIDLGGDAVLGEVLRHPVGAVLGAGEDDGAAAPRVARGARRAGRAWRRSSTSLDALLDALDGGRLRRDLDADRVACRKLCGEPGDLGRHGGGEQRRLPARVQRRDDPAHRLDEAHVEHAVGLVEHHPAGLVEQDRAVVHQVGQPAGRGDHHVDAAGDRPDLGAARHAAEDEERRRAARRRRSCGRRPRSARRVRGSARGPAPGRSSAPGRPRERQELVQDRQREGRGLAGAGLGDAEDVAARELRRDRLRLDRRRGVEAGARERGGERLGEAEVREGGSRHKYSFPRGAWPLRLSPSSGACDENNCYESRCREPRAPIAPSPRLRRRSSGSARCM